MKILVDCYFSETQEKKELEMIPADCEYCLVSFVFGTPYNVVIKHGDPLPVPDCKFICTLSRDKADREMWEAVVKYAITIKKKDSLITSKPAIDMMAVKRNAASFSEKREVKMNKWNPWPEVPAPENTKVLVTICLNFHDGKGDLIFIAMGLFRCDDNNPSGTWFSGEGVIQIGNEGVTAWMSLPEPYKEIS